MTTNLTSVGGYVPERPGKPRQRKDASRLDLNSQNKAGTGDKDERREHASQNREGATGRGARAQDGTGRRPGKGKTPEPTGSPNGTRGAIGEGEPLTENSLEPGAAAADGDLGHVHFDRLDSEDASENKGTDAYLITEMFGNYKQRDLLNEVVAKAPEPIKTAYRHHVIHLLTCAQIYWTDKWHPMHHEDVLIRQLPGGWALDEIEGGTSRLFDFEESVIQATGYEKPGEDGRGGRTREYRINPTFAIRFWQLADEAEANYKLHDVDGEPNRRAKGSAALTCKLRTKSGNKWGEEYDEENDHLPGEGLLDGSMRVLSDTVHKLDISEITEMKDIYKEEWEEAVWRYNQAKKRYKNLAYLDQDGYADTQQEQNQIRKARSKMQAMLTRKERAEGRYHALLSGLEIITRQADRIEDGVAYIQNAYEVQEVSGRLTFRLGGPQGVPAVLKAFAYSMEDVYNYDIKSSQTTGLRQLAEDLRRVGCDVDTEALDTYIKRGGKDWVVENYDLPRRLVKRVEHAIKFGGTIPASMESAYRLKLDESNPFGLPEIAKHVEEYYDDREEQNQALSDLQEIFGPQVQMIEELAEGLLNEYWNAHSYAGGRGKGRVMTNHCGIAFCKHDHKEPVRDDDGTVIGYRYGHEARSQVMAWYLQGLEAAYVHALTVLSTEYDYEVMANEHDGLITRGTIPDAAKEEAKEISGARRAELTDKRFEDEEDVREFCDEHDFEYPSPPTETPCKTLKSNPGDGEPQPRLVTSDGSKSTTSPTTSSPPTKNENTSTNVTPAGGGLNDITRRNGAGRASRAAERAERGGVPPDQRSDPPPPEHYDDGEQPNEFVKEYHEEEFGVTYDETPGSEEDYSSEPLGSPSASSEGIADVDKAVPDGDKASPFRHEAQPNNHKVEPDHLQGGAQELEGEAQELEGEAQELKGEAQPAPGDPVELPRVCDQPIEELPPAPSGEGEPSLAERL